MRISSPFFLSLIVSLAAAGIVFAVYPAVSGSRVLVSLVVFIIVLILVWLALREIVYRRIRLIYRTICASDPQADSRISPTTGALLKATEEEAKAWVRHRDEEAEKQKRMEMHRKEFLGNVSHELKTPIFNLQGYITTLLDGGLEDKSIQYEYLKRSEKNIERLISIVEDLVDISQLETGELKLDKEHFDIIALIREVIETQEFNASSRKIELRLVNDPQKAIVVYADKFLIRQVLSNLVVNSIRYGKENGTTTMSVTVQGDQVRIEISDTGIGIAPMHMNRIFERFYRADKSRSRELGGTGLGLSIVKHIIEAHGQSISVQSKVDEGTTFTATLSKK